MIHRLSLKTKTFALLLGVVLLATLPLIAYYLKTAQALSALGTDPAVESALTRAVDLEPAQEGKEAAALALKKYRQIKVLREGIIREVVRFTMIYFAAVVATSLLVGFIFVTRITRPLKALTEATQKLQADDLDVRLTEKAGGEIGVLEKAFNKMAGNLKIAREQQAIAERRAAWQQVARTIAHEIKNPLTPIKLSTERMYEKFLSNSKNFPEVIKSTTETILSEIDNLQRLVDTFHKYAKYPDPVLRPEPLNEIARAAAELFKGNATPVELSLTDPLPPLPLDRGQIGQALTNFIKNGIEAVEEAGRPGKIKVSTVMVDREVRLSVEDNGCGISAENQRRLFQPYFTTKREGNGIGLALVERIVHLHGGKVLLESTEGRGSRFTIIFYPKEKNHG